MAPLIGVLFLAGACGEDVDQAAEGPETDVEAPAGDRLAAEAFDGEAMTVVGEPYDLSQLAGSDLVLWFWAPW